MFLYRRRWYESILKETKYEDELNFLKHIVAPGDVVLDIGANVGRYALTLSKLVGTEGKVLAFEPILLNRLILEYNLNRFEAGNVVCFPYALSNKNGPLTMVIPRVAQFLGITVPQANQFIGYDLGLAHIMTPIRSRGLTIRVEGIRLDELEIHDHNITFVKCDTEGSEYMVLEGMYSLLATKKPIILAEIEYRHTISFGLTPADVQHLLEGLGYKMFVLESNRLRYITSFTARRNNYFFIHQTKVAEFQGLMLYDM